VEVVVTDHGASLIAGVDAPEVTEVGPVAVGPAPNVVDVVVLEAIARGQRATVAPSPAAGYARVVEVVDLVMMHVVAGTLADPDPYGTVVVAATVIDAAVGDFVVTARVQGVLKHWREIGPVGTDQETAGAQIVDVKRRTRFCSQPGPNLEGVVANGRDLTVFKATVPCIQQTHGPVHADIGLAIARGALCLIAGQNPGGMAKGQPAKRKMLDPLPLIRIAFDLEHGRTHWAKDCSRACRPGGRVPLARLIQHGPAAFEVIVVLDFQRPTVLLGADDLVVLVIHLVQGHVVRTPTTC